MENVGFPYGLKYHDGNTLVLLGAFPRPFAPDQAIHVHLVCPLGEWNPDVIIQLAVAASQITRRPTYVKKVTEAQSKDLRRSGAGDLTPCPWHEEARLEDDTRPEWIIDLARLSQHLAEAKRGKFVAKYHDFLDRNGSTIRFAPLRPDNVDAGLSVVSGFFGPEYQRAPGMSGPADYLNMVTTPHPSGRSDLQFAEVLFLGHDPVGLFIAELISTTPNAQTVGVYANLALFRHAGANNAGDFLLCDCLRRLHARGICFANLGGSETRGLDRFKEKYGKLCNGFRVQMDWAVVTPRDELPSLEGMHQMSNEQSQNGVPSSGDRTTREGRPRSVAMMILINVVLGIALWQAINTCQMEFAARSTARTEGYILVSLLTIFATNLLRVFLGFVSFDVKCGLSEPITNPEWRRNVLDRPALLWLRAWDFVVGAVIATMLIPLGSACGNAARFGMWFFVISVLFVLRNAILHFGYYRALQESPGALHDGNRKAVKSWFWIDLLFLVGALIWLVAMWATGTVEADEFLLGVFAIVLVGLSLVDIGINLKYYFADG
ncbi:MAG TPA: hypothetical protein VM243_05885 [Phycisphaerae bacterium]|nr:hypothetical protein [Phycisphaerae bacterium]